MEWLNWNAQFFDYSDEPYLFYLAETLSKDFNKNDGRMLFSGDNKEMTILMNMFKNIASNAPAGTNKNINNESSLIQFFDNSLFLLVILLISYTIYAILTSTITDEERDEMLNSEDMFP